MSACNILSIDYNISYPLAVRLNELLHRCTRTRCKTACLNFQMNIIVKFRPKFYLFSSQTSCLTCVYNCKDQSCFHILIFTADNGCISAETHCQIISMIARYFTSVLTIYINQGKFTAGKFKYTYHMSPKNCLTLHIFETEFTYVYFTQSLEFLWIRRGVPSIYLKRTKHDRTASRSTI